MEEKSMQSMGGEARAKVLSEEQRSEIARTAAVTRWNIPTATFGSPDHPVVIGSLQLPCYVLDDGKRVLLQNGMLKSLGMSQGTGSRSLGEGDRLTKFVDGQRLKPFVSNELAEMIKNPIKFKLPKGGMALGYEATILAELCESVLAAREKKALQQQQQHIAKQCEILVRGFARVGIIALVDEATGYQEVRDKLALQKILDLFISKELLKWTRRFPDDFYREMFRLKKWKYPTIGTSKPQVVGHYTNDIVYDRLAPSILEELRKLNPPNEKGNRPNKHHQWLTPDVGHPKLRDHISGVIALMKSSDDWNQFRKALKRVYPRKKIGETIEIEFQ